MFQVTIRTLSELGTILERILGGLGTLNRREEELDDSGSGIGGGVSVVGEAGNKPCNRANIGCGGRRGIFVVLAVGEGNGEEGISGRKQGE
jgi:hypothetical protein